MTINEIWKQVTFFWLRFVWTLLLFCLLIASVNSSKTYSQDNLDLIVDADLAQIGRLAWLPDNRTFMFTNSALAQDASANPIWQTYDVETKTLSTGLRDFPLQTTLTDAQLEMFQPFDVLPSSDDILLAFVHAETNELAFVNRITGEVFVTSLRTDTEGGNLQGEYGFIGYWSETDYAFIFPQSSPFVTELTYYHIRIIPDALSSSKAKQFLNEPVDSVPYITFDGLVDRVFALSGDGTQVLLTARRNSDDPNEPLFNQLSYLVIWYPENPQLNHLITTFVGSTICDAAFTDTDKKIILVLQDGHVLQYDLKYQEITQLPINVDTNCSFASLFSYDGSWLALFNPSTGQLRFLNITGLSTQASPLLQPPVANSGSDENL